MASAQTLAVGFPASLAAALKDAAGTIGLDEPIWVETPEAVRYRIDGEAHHALLVYEDGETDGWWEPWLTDERLLCVGVCTAHALGLRDPKLTVLEPNAEVLAHWVQKEFALRVPTQPVLELPTCTLDLHQGVVLRNGTEELLREKERMLLILLSNSPGQMFTKSSLLQKVWGYEPGTKTNTLATHLTRIRNKIEGAKDDAPILETVGRKGYRLNLPAHIAAPVADPPPVALAELGPDDLPVGVGRYVVQSILGEGGMARVFKAELQGPSGFKKAVALKVLFPSLPRQIAEDRQAMFLREARLGGLLHHPNVVDVFDLGELAGQHFLAMEWVEGPSLEEAIQRGGPMPAPVLLTVGRALCGGLHEAHTLKVQDQLAGLVHRDIKPSNVLLGAKGSVKLADFGMAHVTLRTGEDSGARTSGGSPGYMSPEQWTGAPVDHRSDLFNLGLLLYEMAMARPLLGRLPKQQRALREIERVLTDSGALASLEACVSGLGAVVQTCLRLDPNERYQNAKEVGTALRGLAQGVPRNPELSDWLAAHPLDGVVGRSLPTMEMGSVDEGLTEDEDWLAPPERLRTNLVSDPSAFVGRDRALQQLGNWLAGDGHLVSIVGPPGTGKTRLAKQLGAQWLAGADKSCWFCDLTDACSEFEVLLALRKALNLQLSGKRGEEQALGASLGAALAGRGASLLLFDNAERVISILGPWLTRWLAEAPEVRMVVTSRLPLKEAREQLQLRPLSLPDADADLLQLGSSEAVSLFVARAQAVDPSFVLTVGNAGDVLSIVRQLDGLPLAIELAAARVGMWSLKTLLGRLSDRFSILVPGDGDGEKRGTLRGALDWSWDLLHPWERAALAQCSVFHGGFTWDAVNAVVQLDEWPDAPWPTEVVLSLVAHSLVMVQESDGDSRLSLLASVSAYAAERLELQGNASAVAHRHVAYYGTFGTDANLEALHRHGGVARWSQLLGEAENIAAAANRAVDGGWAGAVDATMAVLTAWEMTGPFEEGARLGKRALELETSPRDEARLLRKSAQFLLRSGHTEAARDQYLKALALNREIGDQWHEGYVLGGLGNLQLRQGQMEEALAYYTQALRCHRAVGNRRSEGIILGNRGILHLNQGRLEEALAHYREALAIHDEVGDERSLGNVYTNLGTLFLERGETDEALKHYRKSVAFHRKVGNRRVEDVLLTNLGMLYKEQGRMKEARAYYNQALALSRELGNRRVEGIATGALGLLLAHENLVRGEALLREVNDPLELAKLLCTRGYIEHFARHPDGAKSALVEAESIAEDLAVMASSDLAQDIATLRSALMIDSK